MIGPGSRRILEWVAQKMSTLAKNRAALPRQKQWYSQRLVRRLIGRKRGESSMLCVVLV
jgi:hypothetical protein